MKTIIISSFIICSVLFAQTLKQDSIYQQKIEQIQKDNDALKQQMKETEIGKNFFTSIITTNMTMYVGLTALIVVLAVFIGGRLTQKSIEKDIENKFNQQNQNFDNIINEQKLKIEEFEKDYKDQSTENEIRMLRAELDIARAAVGIALITKVSNLEIVYQFEILEKKYKLKEDMLDDSQFYFMEKCIASLKNSEKTLFTPSIDRYNSILDSYINLTPELLPTYLKGNVSQLNKIISLAVKVKNNFNRYYYSDNKKDEVKKA